jgi:hypothetical protein
MRIVHALLARPNPTVSSSKQLGPRRTSRPRERTAATQPRPSDLAPLDRSQLASHAKKPRNFVEIRKSGYTFGSLRNRIALDLLLQLQLLAAWLYY